MIYTYIQQLLNYAERSRIIEKCDEIVVRNLILDALKLSDWKCPENAADTDNIDEILGYIVDYACENSVIDDTAASRDLFDTKIMGLLTPFPREVITEFEKKRAVSPEAATEWYYDFSKKLNYVRAGRIAKDLKWNYESEFGSLDITINLSKPEKDPRDIAAAGAKRSSSYPKCQLCAENAGFAGHLSHPARQNLRPVPIKVNNENWMLQYSPYGYYNEHCIIFNTEHVPMKIDSGVFDKLFDIIEILPHYFVGSNADLPIVGGSILSHEHFQGGRFSFAMERAETETEFEIKGLADVSAGIVKWPMSVIRLSSENRKSLAKACTHVLEKWRSYSDPDADILAETDVIPHNTITPIARRNGNAYECDLVLRNNRTTEERPMGLFHPHPSLHHIKKENIGLIEVMGLAILPSRLRNEMMLLAETLVNKGTDAVRTDPVLEKHADWAERFASENDITADNVNEIIQREIGRVFVQVLCDAGVFKRDEKGRAAFMRFIRCL
ncbi:MAG: UDP-glucose--hexose-1-phosphate uridylyltransferase [Porcipelethomonas sp.]